jgi:hypothetical protein
MAPCEGGNRKRTTIRGVHLLCKHTRRKRIIRTPLEIRKGFVKFPKILGTSDEALSQPERRNKPGIAGDVLWAIIRPLIAIILISGTASNRCLEP